ncbi:hypothetical protein CAEBREN_28453 [Caenorhabditis brenneri]|uniref:Uncharacterized protein n=1 Tax=Caenorhabditis brenneri TaxID=135651 RepID=G0NGZ8_CAEBE|nr:hypothetical protein CAEBREN_28453 [Caenorhabditis brenneri]
MKSLYRRFQSRTENWKVEFSANVNIKFQSCESGTVLTTEEANFLIRLSTEHENREKRKNAKIGPVSRARKSEESSDYSTSKEFQKLFEEIDDPLSSEEDIEVSFEPPYKTFPNAFVDMKNYMTVKYYGSEEENDINQPGSSAGIRAEQYRKLSKDDVHSSEEDNINKYTTCKAYRCARYSKQKSSTRRKKKQKVIFLEEELRNLELHEEGYFEQRCIRGRIRLRELKNSRCRKLESKTDEDDILKFATMSEVLLERGLPSDFIACCSLCRLLISNNIREEFFFSPCDCIEKFVHTKCALLHQRKMVRQKCKDCQKFNTDRAVCRDTASGIETLEELELYRINKRMTREKVILKEEKELPDRLPIEFEQNCFICFDSRIPRHDSLDSLDSTIIKSCLCNVTAHNECLVQSLLERRICGHCNYRMKFTIIGPKTGYMNSEVGLTSLFLLTSVVFIAYSMVCMAFEHIQTPSHIINTIIMRFSKRKSREWNKNSAVVIKPYQPSYVDDCEIKRARDNRRKYYEEVPYEQVKKYLSWNKDFRRLIIDNY